MDPPAPPLPHLGSQEGVGQARVGLAVVGRGGGLLQGAWPGGRGRVVQAQSDWGPNDQIRHRWSKEEEPA